MAYETGYRSTAADRRRKEAERLVFLAEQNRLDAEGTVEEMFARAREVDCSTDEELWAWVRDRHAALRAEHGIA